MERGNGNPEKGPVLEQARDPQANGGGREQRQLRLLKPQRTGIVRVPCSLDETRCCPPIISSGAGNLGRPGEAGHVGLRGGAWSRSIRVASGPSADRSQDSGRLVGLWDLGRSIRNPEAGSVVPAAHGVPVDLRRRVGGLSSAFGLSGPARGGLEQADEPGARRARAKGPGPDASHSAGRDAGQGQGQRGGRVVPSGRDAAQGSGSSAAGAGRANTAAWATATRTSRRGSGLKAAGGRAGGRAAARRRGQRERTDRAPRAGAGGTAESSGGEGEGRGQSEGQ
jgi:hypothetical protein